MPPITPAIKTVASTTPDADDGARARNGRAETESRTVARVTEHGQRAGGESLRRRIQSPSGQKCTIEVGRQAGQVMDQTLLVDHRRALGSGLTQSNKLEHGPWLSY